MTLEMWSEDCDVIRKARESQKAREKRQRLEDKKLMQMKKRAKQQQKGREQQQRAASLPSIHPTRGRNTEQYDSEDLFCTI